MRIALVILICIFTLVNCSSIINTDKEIYKVVINSLVKPLPPPPPPKIGDSTIGISKKVLDSINKVPINVGVYPFLMDFQGDYTRLFRDFKKTQFDYSNSNLKLNIEDLDGRKSLNFTVLKDSVVDFEDTLEIYDEVLYLSTVKYNDEKDKALVIIAHATGRLSSGMYLCLLQRHKNNWVIINTRRLSVS